MDIAEVQKVEEFMRRRFGPALRVQPRPKMPQQAEVFVGEELVGVLFVDGDGADTSYNFQMVVTQEDLR